MLLANQISHVSLSHHCEFTLTILSKLHLAVQSVTTKLFSLPLSPAPCGHARHPSSIAYRTLKRLRYITSVPSRETNDMPSSRTGTISAIPLQYGITLNKRRAAIARQDVRVHLAAQWQLWRFQTEEPLNS